MPAYGQFGAPALSELALTHGTGFPTLLGGGPSASIALAIGLGGALTLILRALQSRPRPAPVPVRAVRAGRRA
jgi:hypothetical protein